MSWNPLDKTIRVPIAKDYTGKTKIPVRITNIVRKTGAYNSYWYINFKVNGKKYTVQTGVDAYTSSYSGHNALVKHLEMFDIRKSITREVVKYLKGLTSEDIELEFSGKTIY